VAAGGEKMAEEGKPADAQPKPKKTRTTKINVGHSAFNSLTDKQITQYFEEESAMANLDRITTETYEKKNELESYIYDMRNKSEDKYAQYIQPAHKSALLQELEKVENWLYGEGLKSVKATYHAKLDELKKLGEPITNRFREYEQIPEHFGEFHNNLAIYETVVTSNDENFAHITPEERKPVTDAIKEARDWISAQAEKISKAVRSENPPVSSQEVLTRHKNFVEKFYATINKVKTAPKAEEKKPEEAPKQASPQKEGEKSEKGMEEEK
jgi:heat shock protein 4